MSAGLLCTCGKHPPGRTRQSGEPACPHYAANQAIGGQCSSCAAGYHDPCDQAVMPGVAKDGECLRCRWHSSEHAR